MISPILHCILPMMAEFLRNSMDSKALHIFNPDHDLALAHGTNHYVSPASALEFACDAAVLPVWIFPSCAVWIGNSVLPQNFIEITEMLGLHSSFVTQKEKVLDYTAFTPWGWNHNLTQQLLKMGVSADFLPAQQQLTDIYRLSHRRLTIAAAQYLYTHASHPANLPPSPKELTNIVDVERFITENGRVVLKMPWSGSGRGLRRIDGEMSPHQRGWASQSIRKYGCVMGESFFTVIQDFAMEFLLSGQSDFRGYSLFSTHNGIYQGNSLLSDFAIEKYLEKYIQRDLLCEYQQLIAAFLDENVAPFYRGPVGVDMFVYQRDGRYFVHPFVEFNLRMTMGLAAHEFFKNFVNQESTGRWCLCHKSAFGELEKDEGDLSKKYPLRVCNGKIISGYLSLTPITTDTHYAVQVIVTEAQTKKSPMMGILSNSSL